MDFLTHEAFLENLNTKFHVSAEDNSQLDLELAEVSALKLVKTQEQFAVVFRGPLDRFIEQLDGSRSYFLASDIADFERFRYQLDDAVVSGQLEPVFTMFNRFQLRNRERHVQGDHSSVGGNDGPVSIQHPVDHPQRSGRDQQGRGVPWRHHGRDARETARGDQGPRRHDHRRQCAGTQ